MKSSRIALAIFVAALAVTTFACTAQRTAVMAGSERAVGADARLVVEQGDHGNYIIELEAQNLPPANRIADNATTFVVWVQPPEQSPSRVAVLAYDEDARTGEASATTMSTSFDVLVTAETAADVPAPSDLVVFRTTIEAP